MLASIAYRLLPFAGIAAGRSNRLLSLSSVSLSILFSSCSPQPVVVHCSASAARAARQFSHHMGAAPSAAEPVDMSGPTAEFVKQAIAEYKVVIFSKTTCPYCRMAKESFRSLDVEPYVVELNVRRDGPQIQDVLGQMTGAKTVPRVFVNGRFIGGGSDVKALYQNGKLAKLVQ